jgi:peptidoglycan/LPS O-acetylase OafA/YrhL
MSTNSVAWQNPRLAGRIPELDGIRGLAILLVLVWHYVANTVQGAVPGSGQAYVLATLRLAWSGVDLFFVLSGFLIGGILYDAKDSKSYYRTFYSRRIYRIFPLYFMWIALFMAGLHFVGPNSASALRAIFNRDLPVWSYPLFLQNFSMASQATFGPEWTGVTWSLAVEEQFYLLLPLLVRNLSYRGITILAVASILGAPVVRLILWFSGNVYVGPYTLLPCRADALGFGVLVALACRNKEVWEWLASRRRHLYLAFLLLGCGIVFLLKYQRHLYTFGLTWIAAFYALLLLLTVINPGRIETFCFRSHLLVKLGTVAYAVYIFNQGINYLFHFAIFGRTPSISDWSSFSVTLLSLTTVMLLAALSWRLLEKPLIRHAHAVYRYVTVTEEVRASSSTPHQVSPS